MTRRRHIKSRILLVTIRLLIGVSILLLISAVFYIYQHGAWRDIIRYYRFFINPTRLQAFIASFGPFAQIMFIFVQALQVVFAPVPGEVTGFVGGYLFGTWLGTVLSTIGLMIGSSFAFAIVKMFGVRSVEKVVKRKYIEKFNFFITHRGLYIAFILFVIPGLPKDSLCYLLGLTHIRFIDFFLMNLIGRLPGTLMLAYQGSAVKHEQYLSFFTLFGISLAVIVLLYFLREYVIRKSSILSQKIYNYFKKHEKHKSE